MYTCIEYPGQSAKYYLRKNRFRRGCVLCSVRIVHKIVLKLFINAIIRHMYTWQNWYGVSTKTVCGSFIFLDRSLWKIQLLSCNTIFKFRITFNDTGSWTSLYTCTCTCTVHVHQRYHLPLILLHIFQVSHPFTHKDIYIFFFWKFPRYTSMNARIFLPCWNLNIGSKMVAVINQPWKEWPPS